MTPPRGNAIVDVRGLRKSFGAAEVLKGIDLVVGAAGARFHHRPLGRGQEHVPALPQSARRTVRRLDRHRRGRPAPPEDRHQRHAPAHRDGVPGVRILSAHDRARQRHARVAQGVGERARPKRRRSPSRRSRASGEGEGEVIDGAVRRTAAARRHRPRDRALAEDHAVRRAPTSSLDPELAGSVLAVMRRPPAPRA